MISLLVAPGAVKMLLGWKEDADANQRVIDYCNVLRLQSSEKKTNDSTMLPINANGMELSEVSQDTKSVLDQIRDP